MKALSISCCMFTDILMDIWCYVVLKANVPDLVEFHSLCLVQIELLCSVVVGLVNDMYLYLGVL